MKRLRDVALSLIVYGTAGFYLLMLLCLLMGWTLGMDVDFYSAPLNWCCCILFALLLFWAKRIGKSSADGERKTVRIPGNGWVYIVSLLVFLGQVFVAFNTFFYTGWDCAVVQGASDNVSKGWDFSGFSEYFSQSTNNLLIVYIYGAIRRVVRIFGFVEKDYGVFALIVMQCFVNTITGLLIYKILQKGTKSRKYAWLGYLFYFVIIGTSPWILITYSDSTMLFLPIFMIWLWTLQDTSSKAWIKILVFAILGVLGGIGYNMKPQAVICFIAMIGMELLRALGDKKLLPCIRAGVAIIMFVAVFMGIKQKIYYSDPFLNKDVSLTPYHFVMMGLNTETDGAFSGDDVSFTTSFETGSEQVAAVKEEIGKRVKDMGAVGLMQHLGRKMILIYGDGSFSWPNKSDATSYFYVQMRENAHFPKIKAALENLMWEDGLLNDIFRFTKQFCYLGILLLIGIGPILFVRKRSNLLSLLYLNLLGIYLFEMIFEASARHIYIYVPLMIVLAMFNLQERKE